MWSEANSIPVAEARVRFAQYGVICGVANSASLRQSLVFKGGNALDFVWQPNRSTVDLDFSFDPTIGSAGLDSERLTTALTRGLAAVAPNLGLVLAVHRVRQNPPGADKTFITYEARIGYAMQDESRLRQRMAHGEPSPHVIRLDVSVNDPICEAKSIAIDETNTLRIATIEDIVAEKLRALLQQPIRNRERRQDLLDIAIILQGDRPLDRERVSAFLLEKAAARNVPVSRAAFRDPEVKRRAGAGYGELEVTTRVAFIPFDVAHRSLLTFVEELDIPERLTL
ncbi:MAG: nucleotidyl transferase AbiEii/AbiGii toxin family protein [Chloroflexota bacterium]|nr:nucleotidyl transferase AbiEii/AbiGii toxin family protein [Chloroflexota bacterium]